MNEEQKDTVVYYTVFAQIWAFGQALAALIYLAGHELQQEKIDLLQVIFIIWGVFLCTFFGVRCSTARKAVRNLSWDSIKFLEAFHYWSNLIGLLSLFTYVGCIASLFLFVGALKTKLLIDAFAKHKRELVDVSEASTTVIATA